MESSRREIKNDQSLYRALLTNLESSCKDAKNVHVSTFYRYIEQSVEAYNDVLMYLEFSEKHLDKVLELTK